MPELSKRGCAKFGCRELVERGFCAAHQAESGRVADRKEFDRQRGSSTARGYGGDWPRMRRLVLREEPVCRDCRLALSAEVDHIMPMAAGGGRLDRGNLQGLCKACHSRKTATRDSRFAGAGSAAG